MGGNRVKGPSRGIGFRHNFSSKSKTWKEAGVDFPGSPVVKTVLPKQGAQVQSLIRELRAHMPLGLPRNKEKRLDVESENCCYEHGLDGGTYDRQ